MNNTVKIILMIATFTVCVLLGYLLMPSNANGKKMADDDSYYPAMTTARQSAKSHNIKPAPVPVSTETGAEADEDDENDENEAQISGEEDGEEMSEQNDNTIAAAASNANTTPKITSTYIFPRSSKAYNKIGFDFAVKAQVESDDALSYELYETGATTAKYTSSTGTFIDVYPVEGGKYTLKVVNTNTQDAAEQSVSGFNMIDKYTTEKLQNQLNVVTQDKLFYFHFDNDKLKFDFIGDGIDSSDIPASLNALLAGKAANGWMLTVLETPKYDKYNRITYFKVKAEME